MNITDEQLYEEAWRRARSTFSHLDLWSIGSSDALIELLITALREGPWVPDAPPVDEVTLCRRDYEKAPTALDAITFALNWADERRKQDERSAI